MSLTTLIKSIVRETGISLPTIPATLSNAQDETLLQLMAQIYRTIRELKDRVEWPRLSKTASITLVDGQANYALPADWDLTINRTQWDNGNFWELQGPVSAQEWEWRKHGVVSSTPRKRFRMWGDTNSQLFFDPTPGSGDAGDIVTFEYQSSSCISPMTWVTATSFLANSFCSYNGNIYQTASGGTTGATAPTHTSGTVSDGGVSWTYYDLPYTEFIASTDYCLIDETLISLGAQWRFLNQRSLEYAPTKIEYENAVNRSSSRSRGARTLNMAGDSFRGFFIGNLNLPDTGYGQ